MVGSDPSSSRALPGAHRCGDAVVVQHITNDFVKRIRLHGLLHEVACALLQRSQDVVLVADRGNHDDSRLRVFLHNALDRFDALHLRHGYVHQNEVGRGSRVFGDGGAPVTSLSDDLSAKGFDHLGEALSSEDRIVDDQVTHGLAILFPRQWLKLFHDYLLRNPGSPATVSAVENGAPGSACGRSEAHFACKMLERLGRDTTRPAKPRSMAERGMLSTTQVSGLWAMVIPPAD